MSGILRRLGDLLQFAATIIVAVAVATFGVAQIPGAIGDKVGDLVASINPFDRDPVNDTGPAVLQELTALKEFKAASGYYEVVVMLKEGGSLPVFLDEDQIVYVGKGAVDAVVDFGDLGGQRIKPSEDGTAITVTLPAPRIDDPVLNLKTSKAVFRDEGLLTKFKGSDLERQAQLEAVEKLAKAANGSDQLAGMAKQSTREMLTTLLGASGFTDVFVEFDESPASRT